MLQPWRIMGLENQSTQKSLSPYLHYFTLLFTHLQSVVVKIFDLLESLVRKLGSMLGKMWGFSAGERRVGEGTVFRDKWREFLHLSKHSIF